MIVTVVLKVTFHCKNECLTVSSTYKVDLENEKNEIYEDLAEATYKETLCNHNKNPNHKKYIKSKKLSKYIRLLEQKDRPYRMKLSMALA